MYKLITQLSRLVATCLSEVLDRLLDSALVVMPLLSAVTSELLALTNCGSVLDTLL